MSPRPPTRRSTRPACRRSRRRRPTRRCRRTAGRPSTASSATTPPRARRPRSTSRTTLKATKVVRHRRRVRVRQGPGRHRQATTSARPVVGTDTIQQKQTDFSADRHQGQGLRRRRGLLRRLLRRGRPARQAAARRRLEGHVRRRRRRQGPRLHRGRRRRPPRARSSPARACPPDTAAGLPRRLQGGVQRGPRHLLGRGLRRGERSSSTASTPARPAARTCSTSSKAYDKQGVTKQLKFDDKGEPADVTVCAYKVEGGKIVSDQARSSSTEPSPHRGAVGARRCGRPSGWLPAAIRAHRARPRRSWMSVPVRQLLRADRHRSDARGRLRAGRPRLHARLRRAAPDQLRPLRGLHVRHLRRAVGRHASSAARPERRASGTVDPAAGRMALVAAMVMSGADRAAARAGRLPAAAQAQRPAADRPDLGHRRLVRPRRDHGPARPDRRLGRPRRRRSTDYVASARDNAGAARSSSSPQPVFTLGDYDVTNVDILVIVGALVDDGRPRPVRAAAPGSAAASAPSPRTPRPPR